ncbi:hypothetical protein LGH83_19545 [Lichenihabitans sp. PAMC28606]|uniref:hypothetical protein n=1 Tax=Lichenihabitans sp. PAMC28606 TaxID=2880932 RepID=UPI001D0B77E3|nr:hypothetical protein [Lichenihabitans sp. PAMC28606]UDL94653.1 hypothetical protein LGH83_19545 [Lichenihabitans sp. PAMC28606]
MQRAFQGFMLALMVAASMGTAIARPVVPAEKRFWSYDGKIPACDNPDVLSRLSDRFHDSESEYWNSSLQIVSYDQVKVSALRPWGLDHIPRNFCEGRAILNDKTVHEVYFSVAEDLGLIGMDFGVEFCLTGLDREYAYAPNCKMERP